MIAPQPRARRRRPVLITTLLLTALGLGACVLACVSAPADLGLVEGLLRDCPDSPNCVNSEQPGTPASIEPLAFEGDGRRAFRSLVEFLEREPRVDLVTVEAGYLHAVFRTPLMRFRDDVEFRLDEQAGVVHVRSASRVGHSDLGANRDRVESIRSRWDPLEITSTSIDEDDAAADR